MSQNKIQPHFPPLEWLYSANRRVSNKTYQLLTSADIKLNTHREQTEKLGTILHGHFSEWTLFKNRHPKDSEIRKIHTSQEVNLEKNESKKVDVSITKYELKSQN